MSNLSAAPQVYGGDEVGALVLDPGSYSTRAGYAGEDAPRFVVPSYCAYSNSIKKSVDKESSDEAESTKKPEESKEPEGAEQIDTEQQGQEQQSNDSSSEYRTKFKKRKYTYYGDESIHFPRDNTEIKPIVNDEIIGDWDSAIELFDHLFTSLDANVEEQPILLTEPVWNTKTNKLKALEVFLEYFQTPGFYLAKAPACTSFAVGRPNSLIVDIGHDVTSVTPVLDGMCLSRNAMKTHYAGRFVDSQLRLVFAQRNIDLVPRFKVKSKEVVKYSFGQFQQTPPEEVKPIYSVKSSLPKTITKSFENYETQRLLNEMKETLIVVPETPISDSQKFDYQSRYFELPNGLHVEFEKERYEIADSLFNPTNYINYWKKHPEHHFEDDLEWEEENGDLAELDIDNDYVPLKRGKRKLDNETEAATPIKKTKPEDDPGAQNDEITDNQNGTDGDSTTNKDNQNGSTGKPAASSASFSPVTVRGLSALINQTIANVDVDIRQQVAHNIVVTGSLSLIPGLNDRIFKDLSELNPGLKIRLHASGNTSERKNQNWIGGSVLASLGTFHQLWVSKQEYDEVGGDRLVIERFR